MMDWGKFGDGFQFDDHEVIDEKIETIAHINDNTIIVNRLRFLSFNGKTSLCQLVLQTGLVSTFQQPRTEFLVDLESRIHNL